MAKEKDVLMDHEYDGIQELDNDLPPWWLWLFYITIAFSVIYISYYHVFDSGDLMIAEYNKELNPDWTPTEESTSLASSLIKTYHSPYYNPKGEVTPYILALFDKYVGPNVDFNMLIAKAIYSADDAQLEKLKAAFPEIWEQVKSGETGSIGKAIPAATTASVKDIPKYEPLTDKTSLAKGI